MSAARLALAAWDEAAREAADAALAEQRRVREEELRERGRIVALIERSHLREWFPGIEWSVMRTDVTGVDAVIAPKPDHDFELAIREARGVAVEGPEATPVEVLIGYVDTDTETHYPYWSGGPAESLAAIGESIERRARGGDLAKPIAGLSDLLLNTLEAHPNPRAWLDVDEVACRAGLRGTPDVVEAFAELEQQGKIKATGLIGPTGKPTGHGSVSALHDNERRELAKR